MQTHHAGPQCIRIMRVRLGHASCICIMHSLHAHPHAYASCIFIMHTSHAIATYAHAHTDAHWLTLSHTHTHTHTCRVVTHFAAPLHHGASPMASLRPPVPRAGRTHPGVKPGPPETLTLRSRRVRPLRRPGPCRKPFAGYPQGGTATEPGGAVAVPLQGGGASSLGWLLVSWGLLVSWFLGFGLVRQVPAPPDATPASQPPPLAWGPGLPAP